MSFSGEMRKSKKNGKMWRNQKMSSPELDASIVEASDIRNLRSEQVNGCKRPYRDEYTRSLPNSEVNRRRALSVLGWGTAWEAIWVLLAFWVGSQISSEAMVGTAHSFNSITLRVP